MIVSDLRRSLSTVYRINCRGVRRQDWKQTSWEPRTKRENESLSYLSSRDDWEEEIGLCIVFWK